MISSSPENAPSSNDTVPAADVNNPWPGLATFTEDQSSLFHGRDEEIRDLTRRAERNALTVLFGQSGLGKSSLLQAGVFPRLRAASYWPIYVRLDHGPGAPTPTEQIKTFVLTDTARAGTWTKSGSAKPGETLWEFFHHRDDRLVSANGRTVVPVLVLDQFEELFTLGAGGGAERARAVTFMSQLAELVENRPSEQLVARLEESSAEMEEFDFSRTQYRVVISLREDFLPHLENLKTIMPALMENRMRLARMTGSQALQAVVKPGGALVTEDVARAIVEFVAGARGGSAERLAELDVEPPLLSVICRELNERRLSLGQSQITADLVSGNRREILTDFYERSVADLPELMRVFVEDHLLTKSGFRDNLALETALDFPVVTRVMLDTLVSRRLLRIEDRLGVQRVELTHDVLAEVIRASRDHRRDRETLALAERRRQQTETELSQARRTVVRARLIASGCALLAMVAIAAAAWGFVNLGRARAAERAAVASQAEALRTRQLAESGRRQAEQLLNYLLDDFSKKLNNAGQLALLEQLARQTVDYYRDLPHELVVESTERNRAIALAQLGFVRNWQNHTEEAAALEAEAVAILRSRVAAGDKSVETARGLALALSCQAGLYENQDLPTQSLQAIQEAVSVLRPAAEAAKTDQRLQLVFAQTLMAQGWAQLFSAVPLRFGEAAERLLALGGADPKNEDAAASYAITLKGLAFDAMSRNEIEQAQAMLDQAIALETAILAQSPGRLPMLAERGGAYATLAGCLEHYGRMREGLAFTQTAERDYAEYLRLVPTDGRNRQWALGTQLYESRFLRELGRLAESRAKLRESLAAARGHEVSSAFADQLAGNAYFLAIDSASSGDHLGAEAAMVEVRYYAQRLLRDTPAEDYFVPAVREFVNVAEIEVDKELGAPLATIYDRTAAVLNRVERLDPRDAPSSYHFKNLTAEAEAVLAATALDLGRMPEAENMARNAINILHSMPPNFYNDERQRWLQRLTGILAEAVARQGRLAEARGIIEPVVAASREHSIAAPESMSVHMELADLLLAGASAQEAAAQPQRQSLLDEAERVIAKIPSEAAQTTSVRRIARRLAAARAERVN